MLGTSVGNALYTLVGAAMTVGGYGWVAGYHLGFYAMDPLMLSAIGPMIFGPIFLYIGISLWKR